MRKLNERYNNLVDLDKELRKDKVEEETYIQIIALFGEEEGKNIIMKKKPYILKKMQEEIRIGSLDIQSEYQQQGITQHKIKKSPHIDDRLRANRLGESMSYTDRLQYILSYPEYYVKIDPTYLNNEKEKLGYNGKKRNVGSVYDRVMKDFLINHVVIDPGLITQDMIKYLLDGKDPDTFMADPKGEKIKEKFTRPYLLQYEIPGDSPENDPQKKQTSRITFFKKSPAIAVFRSADTHPIVKNPTKHEKTKIQKGLDMYITNSSYDIITQQYKSIEHITKNKKFMQNLFEELQSLHNDTSFGPKEQLHISQATGMIEKQTNPYVLMAHLYNLSKIQDTSNKTIQQNLLRGALNKLTRRNKQLGKYLYYMIPQFKALEEIHEKNKENIQTLHTQALMCASGNNPRSFVQDTWERGDQFNKHNHNEKITRALKQHPLEQKDHLFGIFYTMHRDIGRLLRLPESLERKKYIQIMVYTHRLILAAEQFKFDLQSASLEQSINTHAYFREIWNDILTGGFTKEEIAKYFNPFYKHMKKVDTYIAEKKIDKAVKILSLFKSAIE